MKKQSIEKVASEFTRFSPDNFIQENFALASNLIGMKIFEEPIIGYSAANDPLYINLQEQDIIGPHFLLPADWLTGAKSVVSFFLPFSQQIKTTNQKEFSQPSFGWLHGRIEGQKFVNLLAIHLCSFLRSSGYPSVVPSIDVKFKMGVSSTSDSNEITNKFTSNWSERHVAYLSGLGTFGLSKGLITRAGIAGRFGSIITECEFPPLKRDYFDIDEFCSKCGECAKNCPAGAISIENGKDHTRCDAYLEDILARNRPYYGCGKCQVNVPCQDGIP